MRIVIFSDIHANLEALEAILAETADLGVDRIVCLGDVVGYYADPEECVRRIREAKVVCVQGNHDGVASGFEDPEDFNEVATRVIRWTHDALSDESRAWLRDLPKRVEIAPGIAAVHGSLRDRDEYLLSRYSIHSNFLLMRQEGLNRAVFFGHTHQRVVYAEVEDNVLTLPAKSFELTPGRRFLINPGGAGQPRDRIIGAPFVVLEDNLVHFRIATYDLDQTAQKAARLPFGDLLADRLRRGV